MTATTYQMDLFTGTPATVPRIAASAPEPSAATIGHERPRTATADLPCLVVDGVRNITYYVQ